MPQNTFVGPVAEFYDAAEEFNSTPAAVDEAVVFLGELADGPALEFAIGTGRLALPLSRRGVDVRGVEISTDMLAQLKAKPGGGAILVEVGDMATTQVPGAGSFSLVYLAYNTIGNLLEQSEQVACFANAARHLRPGGTFVIEMYVPQLRRMPPGESRYASDVSPRHLNIDTYDFANQRLVSQHFWPHQDGRMTTGDSHHRYVWPAELDLMAQLAGLRLRQRWGDWNRSAFTGESTRHVSVWEKPLAAEQAAS